MQAIVQDHYGEADQLRLEEIDRPVAGDGQVLVEVRAAGVDKGVWHIMAGLPYPIRLAGYGVRAPKDRVRGREVAGRVAAVGEGVSTFAVGDEVFGIAEGSFAEYAVAEAAKLAPKPADLSFEQAAAATISALTALQAVRRCDVHAGQQVLVLGASGGVGSFAVQIAKAFGAEVTGVCSTSKVDLVESLGADHVVDYQADDVLDGERRYGVIIDTGGHRSVSDLRGALSPRGRLVIVGSETGGRWLGGMQRSLGAQVLSLFVGQTMGTFVSSENAADLAELAELMASGKVTPAVDRTFPLSEAPAAVQYLQDGHARGKVVVTI